MPVGFTVRKTSASSGSQKEDEKVKENDDEENDEIPKNNGKKSPPVNEGRAEMDDDEEDDEANIPPEDDGERIPSLAFLGKSESFPDAEGEGDPSFSSFTEHLAAFNAFNVNSGKSQSGAKQNFNHSDVRKMTSLYLNKFVYECLGIEPPSKISLGSGGNSGKTALILELLTAKTSSSKRFSHSEEYKVSKDVFAASSSTIEAVQADESPSVIINESAVPDSKDDSKGSDESLDHTAISTADASKKGKKDKDSFDADKWANLTSTCHDEYVKMFVDDVLAVEKLEAALMKIIFGKKEPEKQLRQVLFSATFELLKLNHESILRLLSLYVPLLFWSFLTETEEEERSGIEVLILGIYKCQKVLLKNIDVGFGMPNLQKNFSIYHDVDPSVVGLKATRFPYKLEREHVRFDQEDDENIKTLDDSGFYRVFLVLLKMAGDRMGSCGKDWKLFMSFLLCRIVSHGTILPFLPDIPGGWNSQRGSLSPSSHLTTSKTFTSPHQDTRELDYSNISSPPPQTQPQQLSTNADDNQKKDHNEYSIASNVAIASSVTDEISTQSPVSVPEVKSSSAGGGLVTALQSPESMSSKPNQNIESSPMTPQTPLIRFPPSVFLTIVYQEYFEINRWLIPENGHFKRFRLTSPILMQMIDCLTFLRHSVDRDDTVLMMVSLYGLFLIHRRGHLEVMPNVVLATDHFYDK